MDYDELYYGWMMVDPYITAEEIGYAYADWEFADDDRYGLNFNEFMWMVYSQDKGYDDEAAYYFYMLDMNYSGYLDWDELHYGWQMRDEYVTVQEVNEAYD